MSLRKNIIAILLVVFIVFLVGCSSLGYSGTKGGKTKYQDVETEVNELTIRYYADMGEVVYIFTQTDEGAFFASKNSDIEETNLSPVDAEIFDELNNWVDTYNIRAWDGFDMTQRNVNDGSAFRLEIVLATGETITAHGSNAYPNGYEDANNALRQIIDEAKNQLSAA